VAAIAAGVLINTAGFLQSQSEQTGQQSSQQVTDRVTVISETATSIDGTGVAEVQLNVKRAPGAGDIDLSQATLQWVGPDGAVDITEGDHTSSDDQFSVTPVDGSGSTISADSEVYTISLSLDGSPSPPAHLTAGEEASIRITTASGGTTSVTLSAPSSLSDKTVVDL